MLPEFDGWQVIKSARREGIGTPIIVVSARGGEQDRVRAVDMGADDYLVKPDRKSTRLNSSHITISYAVFCLKKKKKRKNKKIKKKKKKKKKKKQSNRRA